MENILNIFDDDAFSMVELTATANNLPRIPGQIGAAIPFEADGVYTTTVAVEELNGKLAIVEPTPRGGPGEVIAHEKANLRRFETFHLQRDESVMADEVQNIRAFGSSNRLRAVRDVVNTKLARHFRDFDTTDEWLKLGVINGKVISGKNKVILDLYKEYGLSAPSPIAFDFSGAAGDSAVRLASDDLRWGMEDDLEATNYGGVHTFCGNTFFQNLVTCKEVRETFLNTAAASELRGALPDVFQFGGITWERYRASKAARNAAGGVFIPDDEARVVFTGVTGLFLTRFAPADYWDTVNTKGLPRYSRQDETKATAKSRGFEVQTNPLHLCTQPKTLRKLKMKPLAKP